MEEQLVPPAAQPPYAPPPPPPPAPKKRGGLKVGLIVLAVLVLGAAAGGFAIFRLVLSATAVSDSLRPYTEEAYPDYAIVDSTIQGHILQHDEIEALRLDVRYVKDDEEPAWDHQPIESVGDGWSVNDTFFRHAEGMEPDPRTGMTYDVEGFIEAYEPVRPGPNAVICGVWLDDSYPGPEESYLVLVARRNPGENMFPDHVAFFARDPETGAWTADEFEAVEIDNNMRE